MRRLRAIACIASVLLLLAGCGGSSSTTWKGVRSVSVTVSQPGLPPPGGAARTTTFASPSEVARVTAALNSHRISKLSSPSSGSGCGGGFQIAITVTKSSGSPVQLSAYRCAGRTSGDVGGDLPGFLAAIGVSAGG